MQDLIADMEREIAAVKQQAIALRQSMIHIESIQTQAPLDPTLQEQLDHLKRSFEHTKTTIAAMEARKKDLIDRMSKALTSASDLADSDDFMTCIPLPEFRRKPPRRLNVLQQETLDADLEALKAKLDQL